MNWIKDLLRDLGKALLLGMAAALAAAVFLFAAGFAIGKGSPSSGLEAAKNGVFLAAALLLFLLAGMLMIKGKKTAEAGVGEGFRKHFKVIGFKTLTGIAAFSFLAAGAVADLLQLGL